MVHERYQQAGGEDGAFEHQVELLRAHGHAVETVEVSNDDIDPDAGLQVRAGLALDTVWSRDGARRVAAAIDGFRPDVLHAHNTFPLLSPAIHAAARARGVTTVQTLHNYRLICPAATLFRDGVPCTDCVGLPIPLPGVVHACYRDSRMATATVAAMSTVHRLRRTWVREVDRIIALGQFAHRLLIDGGLPRDRLRILPNTVHPTSAPDRGPGGGYLFVGRLSAEKGVGTLLAAWERLPEGIGLTIAGTGPMEPDVRAAAERRPSIHYVGRLDRPGVDQALSASRALIVPSTFFEVCPLSVLEAYAAGRPVIGSGHGGIAELVDDSVTGWLIRPGDPADLARVILAAEADPGAVAEAGDAARRRYLEAFSPSVWYRRLMRIYEEATASHQRRPPARTAAS